MSYNIKQAKIATKTRIGQQILPNAVAISKKMISVLFFFSRNSHAYLSSYIFDSENI